MRPSLGFWNAYGAKLWPETNNCEVMRVHVRLEPHSRIGGYYIYTWKRLLLGYVDSMWMRAKCSVFSWNLKKRALQFQKIACGAYRVSKSKHFLWIPARSATLFGNRTQDNPTFVLETTEKVLTWVHNITSVCCYAMLCNNLGCLGRESAAVYLEKQEWPFAAFSRLT